MFNLKAHKNMDIPEQPELTQWMNDTKDHNPILRRSCNLIVELERIYSSLSPIEKIFILLKMKSGVFGRMGELEDNETKALETIPERYRESPKYNEEEQQRMREEILENIKNKGLR